MATMQVCHSTIEQSALLSSVQNHQSARRRNRIWWKEKRWSNFMGTEVARQTFFIVQGGPKNRTVLEVCNSPVC